MTIILGTIGTILGPTIFWLFSQMYYGYATVDEFISTLIHPKLWMVYVVLYSILLAVYINKKLYPIYKYLETKDDTLLEAAQKKISQIPKVIILAFALFCVIGPSTYFVPEKFYTLREYILSELLAISLIFSLAVPFYVFTMNKLESYTASIPLSKDYKFLSIRTKLLINMLAAAFGTILIIIILNLSIDVSGMSARQLLEKNIVVGLFCAIIILLNFFMLSSQLVSPIHRVTAMLKDISEGDGDLTKLIKIDSRDDIGELANWFNIFINNIYSMVNSIKYSTDKVEQYTVYIRESNENIFVSSKDVSNAITEISKGAVSQADGLLNSNKTLNDFSNDLYSVSQLMDVILKNTQSVNENAKADSLKLKKVVDSTSNMEIHFKNAKEKVIGLGKSVELVNEIISVITNIANQTNLLALNAAIEASRAGEAGRGFAVVSEQIRKLAEQTKESSQGIKAIIKNMSTESVEVIKTTEEVNINLDSQMSMIKETVESFKDIIFKINDISPKVESATKLLAEVNSKKDSIIKDIEEVSSIAEESSAASQEIAASAEEMEKVVQTAGETSKKLTVLTEDLYMLVNKFKL